MAKTYKEMFSEILHQLNRSHRVPAFLLFLFTLLCQICREGGEGFSAAYRFNLLSVGNAVMMAFDFHMNRLGSKCFSSGHVTSLNFKTSLKNTRLLILEW